MQFESFAICKHSVILVDFLVIFLFLLLACLSVNFFLPISKTPCESLNAALVSCHNDVKGGPHCVKKTVLNSFRKLNIVGCLPLKKLDQGGRGAGVMGIPGPLARNFAPV